MMNLQLHKEMVVYIFSSFLQLAVRSRDLSQAEKEETLEKSVKIQKMTTNMYLLFTFISTGSRQLPHQGVDN